MIRQAKPVGAVCHGVVGLTTLADSSGTPLAKGHPMGASGAILTSTLLDALDTCRGQYGLVVLTGAMGVGAAMVVERL